MLTSVVLALGGVDVLEERSPLWVWLHAVKVRLLATMTPQTPSLSRPRCGMRDWLFGIDRLDTVLDGMPMKQPFSGV